MNRELVFRAWSPSLKRMSKAFDLYDWPKMNERAIAASIDEIPDPIFLQYSGLIDKNARPIFEGDILCMVYKIARRNDDTTEDFHIVVRIDFRGGGFWFQGDGFTDCNWHFYNESEREVIGNIYEGLGCVIESKAETA